MNAFVRQCVLCPLFIRLVGGFIKHDVDSTVKNSD